MRNTHTLTFLTWPNCPCSGQITSEHLHCNVLFLSYITRRLFLFILHSAQKQVEIKHDTIISRKTSPILIVCIVTAGLVNLNCALQRKIQTDRHSDRQRRRVNQTRSEGDGDKKASEQTDTQTHRRKQRAAEQTDIQTETKSSGTDKPSASTGYRGREKSPKEETRRSHIKPSEPPVAAITTAHRRPLVTAPSSMHVCIKRLIIAPLWPLNSVWLLSLSTRAD